MNERPKRLTTGDSGQRSLSALPKVSTRAGGLTKREVDVACGVMRGASNKEIAAELGISPHTVRDHVSCLLAKLDVECRTRLAVVLSSISGIGAGRLR